ncbi:MAG: hypothetical protein ABI402_09350 [Ferruginibacter sp.]
MNALKCLAVPTALMLMLASCGKNDGATPSTTVAKINFVFKFDSTQVRLNSFGVATGIPAGHAAQSPKFNVMSSHYVELAPDQYTPLGSGAILYKAPETSEGGSNAIDFDQSIFAGEGQTFLSVPIKSFTAGSYNWLRVSLAYQNYDIKYMYMGNQLTGTLASFIGFNSYVRNYKIKDSTLTLNSNKLKGYWGFESSYLGYGFTSTGQAPPGATTVPNPLQATSPIPAGSCVVTGQFATPLVITGNETSDITIVVSLSTNKSFEWTDLNGNGIYEPADGDVVVDMGIRGLIPSKL